MVQRHLGRGEKEKAALRAISESIRKHNPCFVQRKVTEGGTPYLLLPMGYRLYCLDANEWCRHTNNRIYRSRCELRNIRNEVIATSIECGRKIPTAHTVADAVIRLLKANKVDLSYRPTVEVIPTSNPKTPWWHKGADKRTAKSMRLAPEYYNQEAV